MKREIKFRMWHKNAKVMRKPEDIYDIITDDWYDFKKEEWEIMQFTGLLDKNGKEIYEGDIIDLRPAGIMKIYSVVYRRGCFVLRENTINDDIRISMQDEFEMEIIGNIYENSSLLAPSSEDKE